MYFKKKSLDFEYHFANDLNMIDMVITHLNHPWGPPGWFDALTNFTKYHHFQACRK